MRRLLFSPLKGISFCLFVACLPFCLFAQIPELPKTVTSPDAGSLGEYGSYPVSLFTGVPEISIPLYNLEVGSYVLPVFLSYHASGIKPDQHPGMVGTGWSLNAGGMITRKVNGLPDEYIGIETTNKGYYHTHSCLSGNLWGDSAAISQHFATDDKFMDTEPDEFYFNFNGYQGSFYLSHSGKWIARCAQNIKVEVCDTLQTLPLRQYLKTTLDFGDYLFPKSFSSFTLTAEDGTRYVFGGNDTSIEYSTNFWYQAQSCWIATSWMLTEIILPNNKKIEFTYERLGMQIEMYYSLTLSHLLLEPDGSSMSSSGAGALGNQGQLIAPVALSQISGDGIYVNFYRHPSIQRSYSKEDLANYCRTVSPNSQTCPPLPYLTNRTGELCFDWLDDMNWPQIDSIFIFHPTSDPPSIKLSYSADSLQRLTLDSLRFGNQRYRFEYNNMAGLPKYLSKQTDHWGYYNHKDLIAYVNNSRGFHPYVNEIGDELAPMLPGDNNDPGEPDPPSSTGHYEIDKDPDSCYTATGILTKIIYPTGGYTRFVYEPNDYYCIYTPDSMICSWGIGGGLRIKELWNSAGDSIETCQHRYYYKQGVGSNLSSGVLNALPRYSFNAQLGSENSGTMTLSVLSAQPSFPSSNDYQGYSVGYSTVIDERSDGAYSVYRYTNLDSLGGNHVDEPFIFNRQSTTNSFAPNSSRRHECGLLTSEAHYDEDNNPTKEVNYIYQSDSRNLAIDYVRALHHKIYGNNYFFYDATAYKLFTYTMLLTEKKTKDYDQSGAYTLTRQTYLYNDDKLVRELKTISPVVTETTTYKYPGNFVTGGDPLYTVSNFSYPDNDGNFTGSPNTYLRMYNRHILSPVIEETKTVTWQNVTEETSKRIVDYRAFLPQMATDTIFAPRHIFSSHAGQSLVHEATIEAYDKAGNVLAASTPADGQTVYVWGYNSTKLIAAIKGVSLESVTEALYQMYTPPFIFNPKTSDCDSLRQLFPHSQITTYEYGSLFGVTRITTPDGLSAYYEYDDCGRLAAVYDDKRNVLKKYVYQYDP